MTWSCPYCWAVGHLKSIESEELPEGWVRHRDFMGHEVDLCPGHAKELGYPSVEEDPRQFSGPNSQKLWVRIEDADSIEGLRWALHDVCCRLQKLENGLTPTTKAIAPKLFYAMWDLMRAVMRLGELRKYADESDSPWEDYIEPYLMSPYKNAKEVSDEYLGS